MDAEYGELFEEMPARGCEPKMTSEDGSSWRMRQLWSRAKAWGAPLQRRRLSYACSLSFSRRSRRRLSWARQTCQL
jgi:hypothetical protein